LHELIKEQIDYYNYCRYHSAIGFITPHSKYRGKADKIFADRKQKLKRAKQQRLKRNFEIYHSKNINPKAA